MVKLRKGVAYRQLERPYTRFSKYKALSYVRSRPVCKIARFDTGDATRVYPFILDLNVKADLQLRDNALEAARVCGNRWMEKVLGKAGFHFKVRVYPHHVLRENPLASGAGADRLSKGMARSFGKSVGIAARVFKGQTIFTIRTEKQNVPLARKALHRASTKLPCSCSIVVKEIKMEKVTPEVAAPVASA